MFDIVLPVYNAIHHARSCLSSILGYANLPYTLYIVDDACNDYARTHLELIANKNASQIKLLINEQNQGYLYSANRGAMAGKNPYIIFVNSDTYVPEGFLEKVADAFDTDSKIAVLTAVSNWANWTRICWTIPPGHNMYSLPKQLEQLSKNRVSDINNASGFFFAVRRDVFEDLGGFDPVYGSGYWEEADFCMKVLSRNLRVVVDETLFVYHHGWGSFHQSGRDFNMERNKTVFMKRWSADYEDYQKRWRLHNPISYMERAVFEEKKKYPDLLCRKSALSDPESQARQYPVDKRKVCSEIDALKRSECPPLPITPGGEALINKTHPKVLYILPAVKVYGGIISVLQIVNQLIINGFDANVVTWGEVDEQALQLFPMFFNPFRFSSIEEMVADFPDCDLIVATHWSTVYPVYILQKKRPNLRLCYFVQDYEPDFYTDDRQDLKKAAERTYYMITDKIVKTRWLKSKIQRFPGRVHRIPLGLNLDYFHNTNTERKLQIIALGRPQSQRRNFEMLISVYAEIHRRHPHVILALYGFGYDVAKLPFPCKDYGLLTRMEDVAHALNESSILLDCSTFQGFGRPGLEAMACGVFPVLTREGGITQYAKHNYNCLLINPLDRLEILEALESFIAKPDSFKIHLANGKSTAEEYSLEKEGLRTAGFLSRVLKGSNFNSLEPENIDHNQVKISNSSSKQYIPRNFYIQPDRVPDYSTKFAISSMPHKSYQPYVIQGGHNQVQGWVLDGALSTISMLAHFQNVHGLSGSVCEIGVHHGRLLIALSTMVDSQSLVIAIDCFENQDANIDNSGKGDRFEFIKNFNQWIGNEKQLRILASDSLLLTPSEILSLSEGKHIRLFSIDGGHTTNHVINDLGLAESTLSEGGIVIVNDFLNPDWPGVIEGVMTYFKSNGVSQDLVPFCYGDNKLYLCRKEYYKTFFNYVFVHISPLATKFKVVELFDYQVLHIKMSVLVNSSFENIKMNQQHTFPRTIEVPERPPIRDILERHIEQMLWPGRWSYLRYKYIYEQINQLSTKLKKVLSFGCGYGKHEAALALAFPNLQIIGLDIDEKAITWCKEKYYNIPNLSYLCEDIFEHDSFYDFIFTIEVLEHIPDPYKVIDELCRKTNRLQIMVPNKLARYDNPEGRKLMFERHHHLHIGFSIEEISERLISNGFQIISARHNYCENFTTHVRQLFTHLSTNYKPLVENDMQLLQLFRPLYDMDMRCDRLLEGSEEGQGTLVYGEKKI
jgi:GT2 family glycosyltransferase/glycosyltransferase involved in cell wall biosynthesis/SAM-dependent methyltransferase